MSFSWWLNIIYDYKKKRFEESTIVVTAMLISSDKNSNYHVEKYGSAFSIECRAFSSTFSLYKGETLIDNEMTACHNRRRIWLSIHLQPNPSPLQHIDSYFLALYSYAFLQNWKSSRLCFIYCRLQTALEKEVQKLF